MQASYTGLDAKVLDTLIGKCERLYVPNCSIYIFENFMCNVQGMQFLKGRAVGYIILIIVNLRTETVELHMDDKFEIIGKNDLNWAILGEEFANGQ